MNSYDFLLNFKKNIFLKKWKLSVFHNDVTRLGSVGFYSQNEPSRSQIWTPRTFFWPLMVNCEFSCGSILMTSIFLNSYDFLLNFKINRFLKKWKLSVFYNDVTSRVGSVGFHAQNPKRLFYSYLWFDINDKYIFELVWVFD